MGAPYTHPTSSQIILDAVTAHIAKTGEQQKSIALTAGLSPNYFSMLKNGEKVSLARIKDLKRAMPDLDALNLTATVLDENYPEPAADALLDLVRHLMDPTGIDKDLLSLSATVSLNATAAGLAVPDTLPEDIKKQIGALLVEAIQRETALRAS